MLSIKARDPASGQGLEVEVDAGVISKVQPCDYDGRHWLSAGLIDLQVNGYAGIDLNDMNIDPERVHALGQKLLALGVTTFFPTVITAEREQIKHSLQAISQARQAYPLMAQMIPAIHLEGPYISPNDGPRGAHPLAHVRAPDKQEFMLWQACCDSLIRLVTLSPHWPESSDFITWLCKQGITVSIGHTDADHDQISAAAEAGASMSTHLGNGASASLARHPNLIWSQLADDRLVASFIADGHHLPAEALKSMLRAKGLSRSVLVSDVVALGGLAPGVYKQPIGGNVMLSEDGRLGIEGTPYLAGAALPLPVCIAKAIRAADLSLAEALSLATCNTRCYSGRSGKVAIGERADLITFDWQPGSEKLDLQSVVINGELVI